MKTKPSKIVIFTIFIAVLSINANAQIENEINSMVDSTEIIINNGRKLLMKSLDENDFKKASKVYYYILTEVKDDNCSAFEFHEQLLIVSLISDWYKWLELAENIREYQKPICYSGVYQIRQKLYQLFKNQVESLMGQKKDLPSEGEDLLDLYLHLIKNEEIDDMYNEKLKSFKKNYPQTKYEYFVNNFLPGPRTKGSFGFSFGTNQTFQTGNFGDMFSPGTMANMSLDFNINKVYTSFYFAGGNLSLKKPFDASFNNIDTSFNVNESFSYIEGGLLAGYFLVRNSRFHIAPYASISGNSLKSNIFNNDKNSEDLELTIIKSFICGIGLHTELQLFKFTTRGAYYGSYPTKNHLSIKVDIGYNYITKHSFDQFKGNIFYIRPTLVWGMGDF